MQEYHTFNDAWVQTVKDVFAGKTLWHSRSGSKTLEVVGYGFKLKEPANNLLTHPGRCLDPAYAVAELLWYFGGDDRTAFIKRFARRYAQFENNGIALGHYGTRWRCNPGFVMTKNTMIEVYDQLDAVVKILAKDPSSRQAVVTMYDSADLGVALNVAHGLVPLDRVPRDVPCTVSMQFLRRRAELHCVVYMRSNDVWLGLPYDVYCFTQIQRAIAKDLGLFPGSYTHVVGSMHLYERNWHSASQVRKLSDDEGASSGVGSLEQLRDVARVAMRLLDNALMVERLKVLESVFSDDVAALFTGGMPRTPALATMAVQLDEKKKLAELRRTTKEQNDVADRGT